MSREQRLQLIRQVHATIHYEMGLCEPQRDDIEDEIKACQIRGRDCLDVPADEFTSFFTDLVFEGGQG